MAVVGHLTASAMPLPGYSGISKPKLSAALLASAAARCLLLQLYCTVPLRFLFPWENVRPKSARLQQHRPTNCRRRRGPRHGRTIWCTGRYHQVRLSRITRSRTARTGSRSTYTITTVVPEAGGPVRHSRHHDAAIKANAAAGMPKGCQDE